MTVSGNVQEKRDRDHVPNRSNDARLKMLHRRWADLIIVR